MTSINVPQISVMLLGMDDKKAAIFKMAFKMYHGAKCDIITDGVPRVVIVDVDGMDGQQLWDDTLVAYPDAAHVLCSFAAPIFEVAYLPKPIKVETLFPVVIAAMNNEVTHKPSADDIAAHEKAQRKTHTYFKESVDDDSERVFESKADVTIHFFDPMKCLLGHLMAACKENKPTALLYQEKPVVMVFPAVQKILLTMPPQQIKTICQLDNPEISVRYIAENPDWQARATEGFDACIWQFSLWTTQGRLIKNVMPNTPLHLQRWPNITRLAYAPNAIRLAAFLVKAPASVNVLYKILKVDLDDILTFVTASYCIGLLKPDSRSKQNMASKATVVTTETDGEAESAAQIMAKQAAKRHGSILKRLLKKLSSN